MLSAGLERKHFKLFDWYRLQPKILIISLDAITGLLFIYHGDTALPDATMAF